MTTPGPRDSKEAYESWQAFLKAQKRWRHALQASRQASDRHRAAAARLAETDSRLDVHLLHRDMIIEESGVTQLRGTFRLSRWVLAAGSLLTAIGATLYAFGLPGPQSQYEPRDVIQFTPNVPLPEDGTGVKIMILGLTGDLGDACGSPTELGGLLVDGAGSVSEVIVGEDADLACQGRWLLPAGSWAAVAGLPLPAKSETPAPKEPKPAADQGG